jgi:hypothetical protein
MSAGTIQTRIPEKFRTTAPSSGTGVYAWTRNEDGALVPSGNADLSAGQAWEYDGNGALVPTGEAITDDPYWEYDGNDDLVPIAP